jgi:hypothetical protein
LINRRLFVAKIMKHRVNLALVNCSRGIDDD